MKKRILSFLLAVCMMISTPMSVFATEGGVSFVAGGGSSVGNTGVCENHKTHDASCGFAAATPEVPCTHAHDAACGFVAAVEAVAGTAEIPCDKGCTGEHAADCAYTPAKAAVEGVEGKPCKHVHDDACGYKAATAEQPCTYTCELCQPSAKPTATPTAKPSATPNATPSAKPSATPSATATATPSATPSATSTAKPSATPTATSTATPSATPSAAPSAKPSASPSATPTATPTATPSATPSPSPAPACVCVTQCTAAAEANKDCPICAAESADLGTVCKGVVISEAMQALMNKIDALPNAADITDATTAEQKTAYTAAFDEATAAYEALLSGDITTEQLDAVMGAARVEKLTALQAVLSGAATLASETGKVWTGLSAQFFEGGLGTVEDPYLIATAEQLCLLSAVVNNYDYSTTTPTPFTSDRRKVVPNQEGIHPMLLAKAHYKLTADIVLNDTTDWKNWGTKPPVNSWKPIGTLNTPFSGTFEGNGKTVSGMYFKDRTPNTGTNEYWNGLKGSRAVGLFGYTDASSFPVPSNDPAVITNLFVTESYLDVDSMVGSVVGFGETTNIINCKTSGTVTGASRLGGVVGHYRGGKLQNCQNSGNVSAYSYVGGVVGFVDHGSDVRNCFSPKGLTKTTNGIFAFEDIGHGRSPSFTQTNLGHIVGQTYVIESELINISSENICDGAIISPASWECHTIGGTQTFTAKMTDDSTDTFTWSVINGDDKISVDQTGKVTVADGAVAETIYVVRAVSNTDKKSLRR